MLLDKTTEPSTINSPEKQGAASLHENPSQSTELAQESSQQRQGQLRQSNKNLTERADSLDTSLAVLNATLESTADAIVAMDLEGRVISYNSKFVTTWNMPEELLTTGNSKVMMAHAATQVKDPDQFLRRLDELQALPDREAFDIIELRNGRILERYRFPQRVDNRCVGIVVNFRDVTERRRAEEALGYYRAIVDSSDDAIISKTLEGIITSWNYGAERIFGYTAGEAVGRPILMLIPPHLQNEEPMILSRLRRGERIEHYETVRVRKDGRLIDVSLTVSPVRGNDGKVIGVSKIARDITQFKRVQAEREQLLQREQTARAEAEAANRAKDEFLAVVSHELRTPLNAMLGWSELLMTQNVSKEHIQQGLEIIRRNIRVQTRLVIDLLDVSRIITGKMALDVRSVHLKDIVCDSVELVRPEAQAKGVALHIQIDSHPETIAGDPQRVQQCVWNLLSNAIKFTPAGGDVSTRLSADDAFVHIEVRDSGIGIRPEFLPYVFDRLRQADSSATRGGGGLGLGLSIVHHIVELHGGTVTAQSAGEGQGATFTIKLPVQCVSAGSTPEGPIDT